MILDRILSKLKRSRKRRYKIENFNILLPPNHALPEYQIAHKLYDRFLPFIVGELSGKGIIIDVGANVGDSVYSFIEKSSNNIICIEPSDYFFPYLEKNISDLPKELSDRVEIKKYMISTKKINGVLKHSAGTANLELGNVALNTISLDKLIGLEKVELIKTDTDGFDFDVILSARNILSNSQPILYFENLTHSAAQINGYDTLYDFLSKSGYNKIFVFDNFGNILDHITTYEGLRLLNEKIFHQVKKGEELEVHYLDVLCSSTKNSETLNKAVTKYLHHFEI
jgi:FkbM family methyltransferase